MKRLVGLEGFDWDAANLSKNWQKHHVTPWECEQTFFNLPLVVADDSTHSLTENRYYVLGQTDSSRKLFLVFTIRNRKVRVISARDMSVKERRTYDAQVKNKTDVQE
jgi:uncharacterized DUF497 family protein